MKNKVKFLYALPVVLWCLILSSCGTPKQANKITFEENPPFTIQEASFQKWSVGRDARESGVYVIVLFSDIEEQVAIEEVHFRNHISEINNNERYPLRYAAKLTDKRNGIVMHNDPIQEAANTLLQKPIFEIADNQAVLKYTFKDKTYYFKINELSEKSPIATPH